MWVPVPWTPTPTLDYLKLAADAYVTMSEFRRQTPLRPKRKIVCEWCTLGRDGRLTLYARYPWDGASGPTIDTPDSIIASLGHDLGYQLIRLGYLTPDDKETIDRWFYELLLEAGMVQFRAFAWWQAVRLFGNPAIDPDAERPVLRVPRPREAAPVATSPLVGYPV